MPEPWWQFSLDPAERAAGARLPEAHAGAALSYGGYLHLDRLLGAQEPVSAVPDERAFVVTHQLFEIVFKGMIFDLGVVAATFEAMLGMPDEEAVPLAYEPVPDERGPSPFWRPALTAAARLRHAAREILPPVMRLLGRGEDDDVLFSTAEFGLFRGLLTPSSGFQTAQLRLIQRALGKSAVLDLPVFPAGAFGQHYGPHGTEAETHVGPGHPLILGAERPRAFPPDADPAARVAVLDTLAHALLARLPGVEAPSLRLLDEAEAARTVARFRATLGEGEDAAAERFASVLAAVAATENTRRAALTAARRGAAALRTRPRPTCLAFVLDRLAALDDALHAPESGSFLTVHRQAVRRHVAGEGGTGGGGMPYLVTSQRFLLPLFPALVAYSDLENEGW